MTVMCAADGQPRFSDIAGTITGYDGRPVDGAPVRARNSDDGSEHRAFSGPDGRYTLAQLPLGDYVVSVTTNCCTYASFVSDPVTLEGRAAVDLDIVLQEGFTLSVVGDDPGLKNDELRARQVIPDGPVPRKGSGRPDLSGVWLPRDDPFPERIQALPEAEAISRQRIANQLRDLPGMRCLPNNVPPFYAGASRMSKFVQTDALIVVLFEEVPGFRQIFLDGRDHPSNPNPTWAGHSIGRWEGDVLIVDTVGFNDRGWTFTYPRTQRLHIEERYERTAYGSMNVTVTIEDPGVFAAPVVRNMIWGLAPQEEIIEFVCENNKWAGAVGAPASE